MSKQTGGVFAHGDHGLDVHRQEDSEETTLNNKDKLETNKQTIQDQVQVLH